MAIGTPGSRVAIGTRAKPGSGKPSSSPNAVLGNRAKPAKGMTNLLANPAAAKPKPKPPAGGWNKPAGGWKPGTHGSNYKAPVTGGGLGSSAGSGLAAGTGAGLAAPPVPQAAVIQPADVIDQAAIRNLWQSMRQGDGTNQGISGLENQIEALQSNDYGQFKTAANQNTNQFKQNMWDWNAQAGASGMLNSGGMNTNHAQFKADHAKNFEDLNNQLGAGATMDLMGQRNGMRNQAIQQLLAIFGQTAGNSINQIVGG